MGIDQNLKDGAARASDGFEGNGEDGPALLPQIRLKWFGDSCTHENILLKRYPFILIYKIPASSTVCQEGAFPHVKWDLPTF
jgi:hypothetical protein